MRHSPGTADSCTESRSGMPDARSVTSPTAEPGRPCFAIPGARSAGDATDRSIRRRTAAIPSTAGRCGPVNPRRCPAAWRAIPSTGKRAIRWTSPTGAAPATHSGEKGRGPRPGRTPAWESAPRAIRSTRGPGMAAVHSAERISGRMRCAGRATLPSTPRMSGRDGLPARTSRSPGRDAATSAAVATNCTARPPGHRCFARESPTSAWTATTARTRSGRAAASRWRIPCSRRSRKGGWPTWSGRKRLRSARPERSSAPPATRCTERKRRRRCSLPGPTRGRAVPGVTRACVGNPTERPAAGRLPDAMGATRFTDERVRTATRGACSAENAIRGLPRTRPESAIASRAGRWTSRSSIRGEERPRTVPSHVRRVTTPTGTAPCRNACGNSTGRTASSAPPATGPRTRSSSPPTICGASRGMASANLATNPMRGNLRGCGDWRGGQAKRGRNRAGPATSREKGRDWECRSPGGGTRRTSLLPAPFRTGFRGSDPKVVSPKRGSSPAPHATSCTAAESCRWARESENSCELRMLPGATPSAIGDLRGMPPGEGPPARGGGLSRLSSSAQG